MHSCFISSLLIISSDTTQVPLLCLSIRGNKVVDKWDEEIFLKNFYTNITCCLLCGCYLVWSSFIYTISNSIEMSMNIHANRIFIHTITFIQRISPQKIGLSIKGAFKDALLPCCKFVSSVENILTLKWIPNYCLIPVSMSLSFTWIHCRHCLFN